jgi:hypothetical protein
MSRGEVLAACFTKEKIMMNATGTAQFKNEGRLLETTLVLQPHTPMQHEMLERVAKLHAGATMENGQLVLRRTLIVPAAGEAIAQEGTTAASAGEGKPAATGGAQSTDPTSPAHIHEADESRKKCKHCGLSWKKVLQGQPRPH